MRICNIYQHFYFYAAYIKIKRLLSNVRTLNIQDCRHSWRANELIYENTYEILVMILCLYKAMLGHLMFKNWFCIVANLLSKIYKYITFTEAKKWEKQEETTEITLYLVI